MRQETLKFRHEDMGTGRYMDRKPVTDALVKIREANVAPGVYRQIPVSALDIEQDYQRDDVMRKVKRIADYWSWPACGVLQVARNTPEETRYRVLDGKHRALAMMLLGITHAPCMVYTIQAKPIEAANYIVINSVRTGHTPWGKFKAAVVAQNPIAMGVAELLTKANIRPKEGGATSNRGLQSINWVMRRYEEDPKALADVLVTARIMSEESGTPIHEALLDALWGVQTMSSLDLRNPAMRNRLVKINTLDIVAAVKKVYGIFKCRDFRRAAEVVLSFYNKNLKASARERLLSQEA